MLSLALFRSSILAKISFSESFDFIFFDCSHVSLSTSSNPIKVPSWLDAGLSRDLDIEVGWKFTHAAKEVGELLINHGADVNAKNNNSETPLHFAARKSSRMIELLLENKSDVNAKNEQGRTPMDYTSDNEIILLLRKYGGKKGKE